MTMLSLGDLAQNMIRRQHMNLVKYQVQTRSQEMTTGVVADTAAHLRGNLAPLDALNGALARFDGYRHATAQLALNSSTMQAALESIDGFASDLATPLLSSSSARDLSSIRANGGEAREKFKATIAHLNTEIGGQSLFAGKMTDRPPLPDAETLLSAIEIVAAGATSAADLRDAVNAWFDDPAGYAALYQGGDAVAPIGIGGGVTAATGITALSPGVVDSLKALSLAALTGSDATALNDEGKIALASLAGAALLGSQTARADMRAGLAVIENRVAAAQTRNEAEETALEIARAKLVEVDPYAAATGLTEAQTRLETLYAVTSRLSSLSLANYLR